MCCIGAVSCDFFPVCLHDCFFAMCYQSLCPFATHSSRRGCCSVTSHYGLTWSSVSKKLVGFRMVPALGPVERMVGDSVLADDWSVAGVLQTAG